MSAGPVTVIPVTGLPEVTAGADLAASAEIARAALSLAAELAP